MSPISIIVTDEARREEIANGGTPLRSLCREEVARFDAYLKDFGAEFAGGLASWEKLVLEGYLYQKIRGHLDPPEPSQKPLDG
jgi:hypothetical protein